MPKIHGRNANFQITDISGVNRNLSNWLNSIDFPTVVDTAEVPGFGDGDKSVVVGLRGHTIKVAGNWDAASNGPDDVFGNLAGQGASGTVTTTFIIGPGGSAIGAVKYTGNCVVTNYQVNAPIGGAVTFSADMVVSGSVTRTTF